MEQAGARGRQGARARPAVGARNDLWLGWVATVEAARRPALPLWHMCAAPATRGRPLTATDQRGVGLVPARRRGRAGGVMAAVVAEASVHLLTFCFVLYGCACVLCLDPVRACGCVFSCGGVRVRAFPCPSAPVCVSPSLPPSLLLPACVRVFVRACASSGGGGGQTHKLSEQEESEIRECFALFDRGTYVGARLRARGQCVYLTHI